MTMHPEAAELILKTCRQRSREGDRPTTEPFPAEALEDAIIELASQRDDARQRLSKLIDENSYADLRASGGIGGAP